MSRNVRVVNALKTLRAELPKYFEESIMSDCPCDLGLPAEFRKWCGMETADCEFSSEYCERCWQEALGEDK